MCTERRARQQPGLRTISRICPPPIGTAEHRKRNTGTLQHGTDHTLLLTRLTGGDRAGWAGHGGLQPLSRTDWTHTSDTHERRTTHPQPPMSQAADAFVLGLALKGRPPPTSSFQLEPPPTDRLHCAPLPAQVLCNAPTAHEGRVVEACATSATVLRVHGVISGGWVELCADDARGGAQLKSRVVRLFAVDEWPDQEDAPPPESGTIYLSSTLRQNLGLPRLYTATLGGVTLVARAAAEPPHASEVVIARVGSPHPSASAASCRRQLSLHFSPGAYCAALHQGDIFGVPLLEQDRPAGTEAGPNADQSDEEDEDDVEYAAELQRTLPEGMVATAYFVVAQVVASDGSDAECGMQADNQRTVLRERAKEQGTAASQLPDPPQTVLDKLCPTPTALERLLSCWTPCVQAAQASLARGDMNGSRGAQNLSVPVSGTVLLHGGEGVGKFTLVSRAAAALGLHVAMIDGSDLALQGLREAEETLRDLASDAADAAPAVLVIRHADEFMAGEGQGSETDGDSRGSTVVRVLEEAVQRQLQATSKTPGKGKGVLCVAICIKDVADVPVTVRSWCTHEIEVKVPSTECRKELLAQLVPPNLSSHPCIGKLAERTAALTPRDLCALASDATTVAIGRALEEGHGMSMSMVQPQDLEEALTRQNALRAASAIGGAAPSIPDIKWDDVGGLEDVKRSLLDTIELPLKCPHLFASGVKRRSGVLLYGPPGTGKTLLAKAVASQCGLNFLSVKGPELINSYVGESERNVRELFSKARAASPCVVFFDEIDALAPARGKAGDSGGVMDRITSQLLAEIDGAAAGAAAESEDDSEGPVFIMGATNRPDLVDSALLRPGRFDALLYVYVPKGTEPAMKVLKALTRKMTLEDGLVDKLPMLMEEHILKRHKGAALTGADMYGWASAAYLAALKRTVTELIDNGYVAGSLPDGEAPPVVVSAADWIEAGLGVRPSVSESEIQDYEGMRQRYSNTGGSGGGGGGAGSSGGGETSTPSARSTSNQQGRTPPKRFDPSKAAAAYGAGLGNGGLPGLATNNHAQASNPSFPPQRPSASPPASPGSTKQRRMGGGLGGGSGIPGLGN